MMKCVAIAFVFLLTAGSGMALEGVVDGRLVSQTTQVLQLDRRFEASATTTINGVQDCASKNMVFRTSGTRDAQGCADTPITACAKQNKIYAPGATGADTNGCATFGTSNVPSCLANYTPMSNGKGWYCYRTPQTYALSSGSCSGMYCQPDAGTANYLCSNYGFVSAATYGSSGSLRCTGCWYAAWIGYWYTYKKCTGCGMMTSVTCQ